MWEILSGEMDAFVVLADSTDPPSFPDVAELVNLFSSFSNAPHLVVANKTDLEGAAKLHDVRRGTRVSSNVTVMPCAATQKSSVRQVLLQVLELLKKQNPAE
jgi:signal recognition particle receptor subunit beta